MKKGWSLKRLHGRYRPLRREYIPVWIGSATPKPHVFNSAVEGAFPARLVRGFCPPWWLSLSISTISCNQVAWFLGRWSWGFPNWKCDWSKAKKGCRNGLCAIVIGGMVPVTNSMPAWCIDELGLTDMKVWLNVYIWIQNNSNHILKIFPLVSLQHFN